MHRDGMTELSMASLHNHVEVAKALLENGAVVIEYNK